jgi:DNA-binding Lrp family transcriptional regulator
MTALPHAIEQYLLASGFSPTEILILRHLLEGGAMTLRELAGKTGKSTGVLDSASKKLLKKQILTRETVNDSPKLTLGSLDALVQWVHEDRKRTIGEMERREKDLQSFVDSLETTVNRADIQHYDGLEGLQKAYMKLLRECRGQMCHFLPVRTTEVDDPLRDFFVQYFRLRRKQGVVTRVIARDTPLGRRYQSRDIFEYRETLLVPEGTYAFGTEKVVAGDYVGTFNHAEQKAFIIRSKEMADGERAFFEGMWKSEKEKEAEKKKQELVTGEPVEEGHGEPDDVEIKTRLASALREFFLSRKSVAAFGCIVVLAAVVTGVLYRRQAATTLERVREQVTGIAASAAAQFDPEDLAKLRTVDDIHSPEYRKVVEMLHEIRKSNEHIAYAYIMRPTDDPDYFTFVADADSLNPSVEVDLSGDGVMNEADHLSQPGELYKDRGDSLSQARHAPTADSQPYTDQWGTWIAGAAPIRDSHGNTVAIVGFDRDAKDVQKLTLDAFQPAVWFLVFFFLFSVSRFAAFNRSLLKELRINWKRFISTLTICFFIASTATYLIYKHELSLNFRRVREQAQAIAATAALQFNARNLENLQKQKDVARPEYRIVIMKLNEIRMQNDGVMYAYIMRPTNDPYFWEFVADADSLDVTNWVDLNEDGLRNDQIPPGYIFFDSDYPNERTMLDAMHSSTSSKHPTKDPWGVWISGHAPIRDEHGNTVAVFGIDFVSDRPKQLTGSLMTFIGIFVCIFVLLITVRFLFPSKQGMNFS